MPSQHIQSQHSRWSEIIIVLALLLFAVQCTATSAPPLPPPPAGPMLTIGILSPASGELETFGRKMRNGIIMAFEEWNVNGGVLGHHLDWQVYDTQCDFATAQKATQQAIADGRQLLIGPLCSEAALGAAVIAAQQQVLMISPTATHPLVTVDGPGHLRPTIFTVAATWEGQGSVAGQFAADTLKTQRAALLVPANDDYAQATSAAFTAAFTANGGQITFQGILPADETGLQETLNTIIQTKAEIIYLPVSATEANRVAAALPETSLRLLGSDRWDATPLDLALTQGHYFTGHFSINADPSRAWAAAYKATYAIEPDTLAALGYESTLVLLSAIEEANSLAIAEIVSTLETTEFELTSGPLKFDRQHHPLKPIPIIQIEPNGYKVIEYHSPK